MLNFPARRGFCLLIASTLAWAHQSTAQTLPTNPHKAPLYWSVYEYHILGERTALPEMQNYIPESEFAANVDMVEAKLKPHGYDMICVDGWGDTTAINDNGYRTSHSRNWTRDFAWWAEHLRSRGMKLGMYANPLWLHVDAANTTAKIVGTDINVSSLYAADDPWWVQIERPGAEAYVKGYIKHFADMGIDYLRVDFLSWYETGTDRYFPDTVPRTRPGGHPDQYATALRWMREAADEHGVFLSLVMPHLYNEAATEQTYGHMIRVNEDKFAGGWSRWNNADRGVKRVGWSVYANAMDGLTYWSYIAGRGKIILDPDFIRLNTFVDDEERKTVISACLLAGSPITPADTHRSLGRHLWLYTNPEMLALNHDGFVGKPLTNDVTLVGSQIWTGQMTNGDWIVGLFNREDSPQTRSLDFQTLGFPAARVRDLWQHADLGTLSSLQFEIPVRGCRVFRVVPGAAALPGPSALRLASLATTTVAGASGGLHARATWTVTDGTGHPVPGALVTALFGGSFNEEVSAVTDGDGKAVLTTSATVTELPVVQVEALHLAKSDYVYAADLNQTGTTVSGPRMFAGGDFTEWRLQDITLHWREGAWQADRIAFGTHLFPAMNNTYEMKFADDLYFLGNDWGGASGTNSTARPTTFNRGTNIVFNIQTNGLYNLRFETNTLAYSILPEWFTTDVGAVGIAGITTTPSPLSFVLRASGADIETTNDEFHFAWQTHSGDLDMQAKVTSLTPTDPWAKAGLMIRSATNDDSRHASILLTPDIINGPDNGVIFQSRNSIGGTTANTVASGQTAPLWLRLRKSGTNFRGYYSTNGANWTLLQQTSIDSIGTTFLAGLAACGHSDGTLTEARFDEVHIRTNTNAIVWSPATPVRGRSALLTYYAEDGPLAASSEIYARIRSNGGTEEMSPVPRMTRVSPEVWTLAYNVTSDATNLVVSFYNETGAADMGGTNFTAAGSAPVLAPPTSFPGIPMGPNPYSFATGDSLRFSWEPAAPEGGLAPLYRVSINRNGSESVRVTGRAEISVPSAVGDVISVTVQPVHPFDVSRIGATSTSSADTLVLDKLDDADMDGMPNGEEEMAGTDPFSARSLLSAQVDNIADTSITLSWLSVPGKSYRVQWCDDLTAGFIVSGESPLIPAASGTTTSWTDVQRPGSSRFYRINLVP
jgi:hypothetical protein